jgi:hypothetical protein
MAVTIGAILGSVAFGTLLYANLPTRITIGAIIPTVEYLADTRLKLIEPGKEAGTILAGKDIMVGVGATYLVN